jgi:hypothetical protein
MNSQINSGRVAVAVSMLALVGALGGTAVAKAGPDADRAVASKVVTTSAMDENVTDADGQSNGGDVGIAAKSVTCPEGTKVIGGGAKFVDGVTDAAVYLQSSAKKKNGWAARGVVDFGAQGNVDLVVYAYCQ